MLSRRRSVVCVKKGSIDRLREARLGDSGSLTCDNDCRVGGWAS